MHRARCSTCDWTAEFDDKLEAAWALDKHHDLHNPDVISLDAITRELMKRALDRHGRESFADVAIFHATRALIVKLSGGRGITMKTYGRLVKMAINDGDGAGVLYRLGKAHYDFTPTTVQS